ncbi:MAG: hypothetical protein HY675_11775 [Chloroflexi bacterium]|nr:hypothetical protein [Chloroflexota bacterium]
MQTIKYGTRVLLLLVVALVALFAVAGYGQQLGFADARDGVGTLDVGSDMAIVREPGPLWAARPAAEETTVPPVAVIQILPVAANLADPYVIKAALPGTTSTVAMGATGLPNVPIDVPVVLRGASADPKAMLQTYAWTFSKPSKSKAALSRQDAEIISFVPDVPGVYKIDLVAGNQWGRSSMESVQIRAGTYIGVAQGNCQTCHDVKFAEWSKTNHAKIFTREIDGGEDPTSSHYGEGCVRCHSTGYYIGAKNGGFAEVQSRVGWKFPVLSSIQTGTGNWAAVPDELKAVANIQCENCHGPASEHVASKAKMATSLNEGTCNVCHNGGGHHIKGEELKSAKHSDEGSQAWTYPVGPSRQDCVRCHSGKGYISFVANPTEPASWDNGKQTVTCAVCHDAHAHDNKFQLRVVGVPIAVAGVTKDFGLSATCAECHNARTTAVDAAKGVYPHYSPAAEMLSDVGGVDYGQKIVNSPHGILVGNSPIANPSDPQTLLFGGAVPGGCVTCHMWLTPEDAKDPNRFKVGEHSFNMTSPDGAFQYTASCQSCHGGIASFNLPSKADYDGNGAVEGVQTEVAGLLSVLQQAIADSGIPPVKGHPYFDANALARADGKQKNAIYNYRFVRGLEDSDGKAAAIHNFKRSVQLLQLAYKDLTGNDVPYAAIVK